MITMTTAALNRELRKLASQGSAGRASRAILFGHSGSGAELLALTVSGGPEDASEQRITVVLLGQQHGDEPAGAEALLMLAQEAVEGRLSDRVRDVDLLIVPRMNPDGADSGRPGNA